MITVLVKKLHDDACMPAKADAGAAGFDLVANEYIVIPAGGCRMVKTGVALEIPDGYEGQVRPRSGMASRSSVTIPNSPGTIDSSYRGEIKVVLINHGMTGYVVAKGDRIAQLVIASVPKVQLVETQELSQTERSEGGFGSTGV